MNILNLFVVIPLVMLLALWLCNGIKQIRTVMVVGSTLLLALSVYLTIDFISLRNAGEQAAQLYVDSWNWYPALNIKYSIGADGVSVAMILLSSIIVFTGTFASWNIKPQSKEFFLWYHHRYSLQ